MITSSSPANPIQPVQRSFVAIRRSFRAFAPGPVSRVAPAFLQATDLGRRRQPYLARWTSRAKTLV